MTKQMVVDLTAARLWNVLKRLENRVREPGDDVLDARGRAESLRLAARSIGQKGLEAAYESASVLIDNAADAVEKMRAQQ